MLPPKHGIKRRRSASKCEESLNHQSLSVAGRLRKRSRLGKPSRVLEGGAVGGEEVVVYPSTFGWPYYPRLSNEQILNWLRMMEPPLKACLRSQERKNRNGLLTPTEVTTVTRNIEYMINKLRFWKENGATGDMLAELVEVCRFMNVFVVTNITPCTSVRLNHKSFVNTQFDYNSPLIFRLEDAFSDDPVYIRDWRESSGATEQRPKEDNRLLQMGRFEYHEDEREHVFIVTYRLEDDREFYFKIEWFGPHQFLPTNQRNIMPEWVSHIETRYGFKVPDSLLVPRESIQQWLRRWERYLWDLVAVRERAIHRHPTNEGVRRRMATAKNFLRRFSRMERGHPDLPLQLTRFHSIMNRIRVMNLTRNSVVLLRTTQSSHAFQYFKADYVDVYPADTVAAELHFTDRSEVYQIRRDMVKVDQVEDWHEVRIVLSEDDYVVLKIDWMGPYNMMDENVSWENFMGLTRKNQVSETAAHRAMQHRERQAATREMIRGAKLLQYLNSSALYF